MRARVGDVVDALIDVGDVTPVRLSGKASLVLSRPRWIAIAPQDFDAFAQALQDIAREELDEATLQRRLATDGPRELRWVEADTEDALIAAVPATAAPGTGAG